MALGIYQVTYSDRKLLSNRYTITSPGFATLVHLPGKCSSSAVKLKEISLHLFGSGSFELSDILRGLLHLTYLPPLLH